MILTAELLEQLSRDGASKAANELCTASARLLVETQHRPARRQAAVVVANLATTPKLRAALLESDNAATPGHAGTQRRLVDSLVELSMGVDAGGAGIASTANKKEEEIGMRRECMRALVGLAKCQAVRNTVRHEHKADSDFEKVCCEICGSRTRFRPCLPSFVPRVPHPPPPPYLGVFLFLFSFCRCSR